MAVTAMPKGAIADAMGSKTGLAKKEVSTGIADLVTLATAEVKKTGKFTLPGLCMLKTRIMPARKAGTATAFGKTIKVKATSHKDCQGLLRLCSEKQHLKSYCASDHIRHSSPGE